MHRGQRPAAPRAKTSASRELLLNAYLVLHALNELRLSEEAADDLFADVRADGLGVVSIVDVAASAVNVASVVF